MQQSLAMIGAPAAAAARTAGGPRLGSVEREARYAVDSIGAPAASSRPWR
jgi:hypothetical protein